MIRALIFDCFGVLTTEGWLAFKEEQFGHSEEQMDQATELNRQAAAGLMSYEDFVQAIADLSNVPSGQVMAMLQDNVANRPLFAYIEGLKGKYKIGMLSNIADNRLSELFTPKQLAVFDKVVLSYESGFVKPDPRAYQLAAEQLAVEPAECIMIDDQERNCIAAQDLGMRAVWYQDFRQAKRDLEQLLLDAK